MRSYDQVVLDLDGCVWVGERPTRGAAQAISELRADGKRVAFVTNNSWISSEACLHRLHAMDIPAAPEDLVAVGDAFERVLRDAHSGDEALVIGSPAIRAHVERAGLGIADGAHARRAGVVVVAGTERVSYGDLRDAALAVRAGAELYAACRDATYPQPDGLWPGVGAIVAAIEAASERSARIVGKPEPALLLAAIDRLGPGRTLVVGDRIETDVEAAARIGVDAAIVLTGAATATQAAAEPRVVAVAADLAALLLEA